MENIAYLLFFLSLIGIFFVLATIVAVGDYSFNAGFRSKIYIIFALGFLAYRSYLWVKEIKK
ncbi:hypothetical protein ACI1TM_04360 [Lactococcus garvieae]|uniref:hypothetical protein n=1 Tax=Lactococcus garvieae TaxID=1363 RepID=UPI00385472E5